MKPRMPVPESRVQKPRMPMSESHVEKPRMPVSESRVQKPRMPVSESCVQKPRKPVSESRVQKPRKPVSESRVQKPKMPVSESRAQKPKMPVSESRVQKPRKPVSESRVQKPRKPVSESRVQKPKMPVSESRVQKPRKPVSESRVQKPRKPVSESRVQKPRKPQPESRVQKPRKPQPGSRVQKGKRVKAGRKPPPEHATDMVPAAPRKPQEFSSLAVLTASDKAGDEGGSKPTEVHCATSLEMSGPATVASTLQMLSDMEQERIVHRKRSRVDTAVPQPLEFLKTPFGGRLLVHESFLYKQEKAVGDKVYWKCRQHAALGCRGRAVTRGLRATVMREHCHPPDEEGLEARRQKGKLPSPTLPEGTEDSQDPEVPTREVEERLEGVSLWLYPVELESQPEESEPPPPENEGFRSLSLQSLPPKKRPTPGMKWLRPLEFLKTCYGGNFLVHQSFIYKREKTVRGKVYWTCRDHALYGCRSRAITEGHQVTVMRGHCHTPDMKGLEARRQQEKAIKKVQMAKPFVTDDCSAVLIKGVNSLFYHRGALTRARTRAQAEDQEVTAPPDAPQESPDEDQDVDPRGPEFLKTPLGGSFLVYESFLYRREKAAGDKVYWTCRDQARMGCRSRAITQGRQVTVMRGHCHPPDLMGLETLRQREKCPSATQWDSPGGPEFVKTPLGGSFLVYESFLYRREKAAGDKVYWTCRDQARMGCRSRAITQGQRVMVMRRHCHPPDLGGLEALRQRENFPNLTQWEGPEPLQPLEFLRTSLGGQFLVFESFLYRKEKAAGEKVYWMCRDQARLGCRSRAITQGRRVMVMRSHCHLPDLAGLEALRQRERLPIKAKRKDPGKIKLLPEVQLCLETCSPESQQTYGNLEAAALHGKSQ